MRKTSAHEDGGPCCVGRGIVGGAGGGGAGGRGRSNLRIHLKEGKMQKKRWKTLQIGPDG